MDRRQMIRQLQEEHQRIADAIVALERLESGHKRRGRPSNLQKQIREQSEAAKERRTPDVD